MSDDRTSAQYSCDVGYSLKGPKERTCQNDGSGWNLSGPECGMNQSY